MKFAVCTIIKKENLYIREWVEHYINIGFDKIIIYDHNSPSDEIPNIILQDYIDKGIVDIINWRNDSKNLNVQTSAYNNCISKYQHNYDWIGFFDADEFLYIEEYTKIQYLFEDMPQYNNYNEVLISLYYIGDDNNLYYENKPVQERFVKHVKGPDSFRKDVNQLFKCMIKTPTKYRFTGLPHTTNAPDETRCNIFGNTTYGMSDQSISFTIPNHKIAYLKHYYTKSLTEFLYRRFMYDWYDLSDYYLSLYKTLNGWTDEHEKVYQNFLKQNNLN